MSTLKVTISDAAIKRAAKNPSIRQIKDPARPLVVRFHKNREKATWYLRRGQKWPKIGRFPDITTTIVNRRLPELLVDLAIDASSNIEIGTFETCGDVLTWYRDRMTTDRKLSDERKQNCRSVIDKHLLPPLKLVQLIHINHALIDEQLIWELQARYSLSNVRLIFSVLKVAFKQAALLRHIEHNPVSDLVFTDFIQAKITPKDASIRADDIPLIIKTIQDKNYAIKHLIVMMLLHGTRIGETRKAKWSDIDNNYWFIPAVNTKTKTSHRLPLTEQAKRLLNEYRLLQKKKGYTGQYLFPSTKKDGKCLPGSSASRSIRSLSKGNWAAHDLRKVARTVWADQGVDYMVGEMLLNHALSKLDKTYIHTHVDHKMLEALEKYHCWLNV
ncbi:tyrosine-type recombinase/integrase [Photobacterium toruni]|uniref:Prophage CP4-57 integrase n=1 Tax=Photobacterium toruni TaxID=1935446 RepID=A0A1T4UJ64_9GAMM|nr:site-specific integrase [Photobacterium toruni]SKA52802.1 Prophage CP4-57 integrase [Photobacterium toruni]